MLPTAFVLAIISSFTLACALSMIDPLVTGETVSLHGNVLPENAPLNHLIKQLQKYSLPKSELVSAGKVRYPLEQKEFVMPEISTIRSPITVAFDLRKIYWGLQCNEVNMTLENERVQDLLFERLLMDDTQCGMTSLREVDKALMDTYKLLYEQDKDSSIIPETSQSKIISAVNTLMVLRGQLVGVLHGVPLFPNSPVFAELDAYLSNEVTYLNLSHLTKIPEERLLVDILRGLERIVREVADMNRKRHT